MDSDLTHSRGNPDKQDLIELLLYFWSHRIIVLLVILITMSSSVYYVNQLNDIYTAKTTLAPNTKINDMTQIASRVSGFGAFSAFTGNVAGNSKIPLARSIMESRNFYRLYFYENVLPEIYAVTDWDKEKNKLVYDDNIYDETRKIWMIEKPSLQQSHSYFLQHFSLDIGENNNLIFEVRHYSPYFAKELSDQIIQKVNSTLGQKEIDQTKKAIEFLSNRRSETNLVGMREVIAKMIEEQTKVLMLANISEDYVFNIIDPSVIPESPSGPNRRLTVMLSFVVGVFLSILIILIRKFFL